MKGICVKIYVSDYDVVGGGSQLDTGEDVVFRSSSPGPGQYQNMLLHSGVVINNTSHTGHTHPDTIR